MSSKAKHLMIISSSALNPWLLRMLACSMTDGDQRKCRPEKFNGAIRTLCITITVHYNPFQSIAIYCNPNYCALQTWTCLTNNVHYNPLQYIAIHYNPHYCALQTWKVYCTICALWSIALQCTLHTDLRSLTVQFAHCALQTWKS